MNRMITRLGTLLLLGLLLGGCGQTGPLVHPSDIPDSTQQS